MQQILTAKAAPGMTLAKAIATPEGRVLCGRGTALDDALLDRLKKMDITTITVEGHPVAVEGEKSLSQEIQDIEKRFSKVEHQPPLMHLKKRIIAKVEASHEDNQESSEI